jgi:hypothetical protein
VARLPGRFFVAATISNTRSSKTHSFVLCMHLKVPLCINWLQTLIDLQSAISQSRSRTDASLHCLTPCGCHIAESHLRERVADGQLDDVVGGKAMVDGDRVVLYVRSLAGW